MFNNVISRLADIYIPGEPSTPVPNNQPDDLTITLWAAGILAIIGAIAITIIVIRKKTSKTDSSHINTK